MGPWRVHRSWKPWLPHGPTCSLSSTALRKVPSHLTTTATSRSLKAEGLGSGAPSPCAKLWGAASGEGLLCTCKHPCAHGNWTPHGQEKPSGRWNQRLRKEGKAFSCFLNNESCIFILHGVPEITSPALPHGRISPNILTPPRLHFPIHMMCVSRLS